MNTNTIRVIIQNAQPYVRRSAVITWVVSALVVTGAYYTLSARISSLEYQLNKNVEVTLGPRPPTPDSLTMNTRPSKFDDKIAHLYHVNYKIVMTPEDIECLARNIYYEAKFEPYVGKIAVAQVTFNRTLDGRWGDTICKVVYAHKQFSWTLNPRLRNRRPHGQRWKDVLYVAKRFQHGARVRGLEDVKWYHAEYVHPKWRHDYSKVNKYGLHIFYRERGGNKGYTERQLIADSGL